MDWMWKKMTGLWGGRERRLGFGLGGHSLVPLGLDE